MAGHPIQTGLHHQEDLMEEDQGDLEGVKDHQQLDQPQLQDQQQLLLL